MTLLTRTGLRINRYGSIADFPFFKMSAVRYLGFLKVKNFNFRSVLEAQCASLYQISLALLAPPVSPTFLVLEPPLIPGHGFSSGPWQEIGPIWYCISTSKQKITN